MIPVIGSQTYAYHYRPAERLRKSVRILDSQHNIIFLINRHSVRHQVKIPEIGFTFFQFYYHNIRIGCRPLKLITAA